MTFRGYVIPKRLYPCIAVCAALFLLSFVMRFGHFAQSLTFGDDQGRDALIIRQHLDARQPFVLGPKASVGNFYLPPLYYYVMALPMFLSHGNPVSMYLLIVFVESWTPVLVYLFLRRYWSEAAGQIGGVLYALAPYAIIFASQAWNPNMIPLFTMLFLIGIFAYLLEKKDWAIIPAFLSAAIAFQLHYQSIIPLLFAGAVFLYALIIQRRSILPWILAGGTFLLTFLPLLLNQHMTVINLQNIRNFFVIDHAHFYQTVRTADFIWNYIPHFAELLLGIQSGGYFLGRIVFYGSSVFCAILAIRGIAKKKINASLLLLVFLCLSLIGLRLYRGDKLEYYLSFLYPMPALFVATLAMTFPRKFVIALAMVIAFWAAVNSPPILPQRRNDMADLNSLIKLIDTTYGPHDVVRNFSYLFYRDPLQYIWTYTYNEKPWTRSIDEPKHLYICNINQGCASARSCTKPACASFGIEQAEGREFVYASSFQYREFEIVEYKHK
jgi:4-amino-4-deoxy-L-arabinose transferase-like glycosyltransferase